jgi:hypothetical protein
MRFKGLEDRLLDRASAAMFHLAKVATGEN